MMLEPPAVFICYRSEDSQSDASRLAGHLRAHFGDKAVFFGADSIALGSQWPEAIGASVEAARVVLVVIGPLWLEGCDAFGRRFIDSEDDWVRQEIEASLTGSATVIPVLVRGADIPPHPALPPSLRSLVFRHGVKVGPETWNDDLKPLVKTIFAVLDSASRSRPGAHNLRLARKTFLTTHIEIDSYREDLTAVADIRIVNRSDHPIVVNGVRLTVSEVEDTQILGHLDVAAAYDVDLSILREVGDELTITVAQFVGPLSADRFELRFAAAELPDNVFRRWLLQPTLGTTEGSVTADRIEIMLPWDLRYSLQSPSDNL